MKKCIEIAVSVFILVLGLSVPVAAQDATYSCGTYGAGDYSTNDCATNSGGGSTSGETGTSSSSGGSRSGSSSAGQGTNSGADTTIDESTSDPEPEGGLFAIIFAKLATSWGWVSVFVLLVIAGVVLIGVTRRRHSNSEENL